MSVVLHFIDYNNGSRVCNRKTTTKWSPPYWATGYLSLIRWHAVSKLKRISVRRRLLCSAEARSPASLFHKPDRPSAVCTSSSDPPLWLHSPMCHSNHGRAPVPAQCSLPYMGSRMQTHGFVTRRLCKCLYWRKRKKPFCFTTKWRSGFDACAIRPQLSSPVHRRRHQQESGLLTRLDFHNKPTEGRAAAGKLLLFTQLYITCN